MPDTAQRLIDDREFTDIYGSWKADIQGAIDRSAVEGASGNWALVGIKRRGALLAQRLRKDLRADGVVLEDYGEVDISLYRDDYHLQTGNPQVLGTEISFAVDGASIVLVDDVLYTGRTVRAAMDLILDFGRPRRIWLAVFVDRGHRELPIAANFVGREVVTSRQDRVLVLLTEMGEREDVIDLIPETAEKE